VPRALGACEKTQPDPFIHISDIENDRRVRAEDVLRNLGTELDLTFHGLMSKARNLGDQAERYIADVLEAATLFRLIYVRSFMPFQDPAGEPVPMPTS
jgi:hypothetical protein